MLIILFKKHTTFRDTRKQIFTGSFSAQLFPERVTTTSIEAPNTRFTSGEKCAICKKKSYTVYTCIEEKQSKI